MIETLPESATRWHNISSSAGYRGDNSPGLGSNVMLSQAQVNFKNLQALANKASSPTINQSHQDMKAAQQPALNMQEEAIKLLKAKST